MREKRFWTIVVVVVVLLVLGVLGGGRWLWHLLLAMHGVKS
jgi:hypothetical protein